MNYPDWEKLKALFAEAADRPAQERTAFVRSRCNGDIHLLQEVNSLLASADEMGNVIEDNVIDLPSVIDGTADYSEKRFGNYRIIGEIASGGMGSVFLAERDDGQFSMNVALKIVRQSIADRETIDRFKRERQILASLNHPNIAVLHDGGLSEKGEPFLAMEYVDGETLTEYADNSGLSIRERLRLFLKVCSAVSYAHRNLVVHRDIKPSNILINRDGEPKLLDFGLAKSFEPEAGNTQTAVRAFTPAYAAPEQIQGGHITTSSDVYSLGVVLYELLTGTKPIDLENKSFEEVLRAMSTAEPTKPSAVQSAEPGSSHASQLRGDLDNIALMALRKEPELRFASVEDLAGDIERHLAGLPITAHPNTFSYRTKKFIRRNALAVTGTLIIAISLLAVFAVFVWQGSIARRESAKSEAMNQFLQRTLLTAVPDSANGGRKGAQATIVDILNEAARRLDADDLYSEPGVRAELQRVIGEGYLSQGMYAEAETILKAALEEQTRLYGAESTSTLKTDFDLASLYLASADYEKGIDINERRMPALRAEFDQGHIAPDFFANKLADYAITLRARGDTETAKRLLQEAVAVCDRYALDATGDNSRMLITLILLDEGEFDQAKAAQEILVSRLRQVPDDDASQLPPALTLMGSILMEKMELKEAEADLLEGEHLYRRLYGPDNQAIFDNVRLQAQVSYLLGNYREAEQKINAVLENYRKTADRKYISFATALTVQGLILDKLGRSADAERVLREALQLRSQNLPESHFMTALTKGALGEVLLGETKVSEAEPLIRSSSDSLRASQKTYNPRVALASSRLKRLEEALERPSAAN